MKPGIDVSVTAKPYESIFEVLESGGSRAEFHRSQGIQDEPALAEIESSSDVIEVEVDYLIRKRSAGRCER